MKNYEQCIIGACALYVYGIPIGLIGYRTIGLISLATSAILTGLSIWYMRHDK